LEVSGYYIHERVSEHVRFWKFLEVFDIYTWTRKILEISGYFLIYIHERVRFWKILEVSGYIHTYISSELFLKQIISATVGLVNILHS
jgi:hypothetical protein